MAPAAFAAADSLSCRCLSGRVVFLTIHVVVFLLYKLLLGGAEGGRRLPVLPVGRHYVEFTSATEERYGKAQCFMYCWFFCCLLGHGGL